MGRKATRKMAAGVTCLRKIGHGTKAEAEEVVARMARGSGTTPLEKATLRAYRCGRCKLWHVGKSWGTFAVNERKGA
jgi:hypothetical protein